MISLIHDDVFARFVRLIEKDHLAHAYLFIGPKHIGKRETALAVAKLVNCEKNIDGHQKAFCNECASCKRIESGNHPDVHVFTSQEDSSVLKIDQIRTLLSLIKLRSFDAKRKVFILENAEEMTTEASNALLKTLEEPSPNSLIILTTSVPEKNLDTIRSRCHSMQFFPAAYSTLASLMESYYNMDSLQARFLAHFSEGCTGKALFLHEQGLIQWRDEVLKGFVLSSGNDQFTKKLSTDKGKLKEFVDILLSWLRDALLLKAGAENNLLIHEDRLRDLEKFAERFSFDELKQMNYDTIDLQKNVNENFNIKIPLETLKEQFVYG